MKHVMTLKLSGRFESRWSTAVSLVLFLLVGCSATPEVLKTRYRLVVHYDGILCERTTEEERSISEAIAAFEARKHTRVNSRRTSWGLEGERSTCYSLSHLSRTNQAKLIAELRHKYKFECASFSENATCPGRPRRNSAK